MYIAFLDARPDTRQFLRKVSFQFEALKKANSDSYCYVIGTDLEGIGCGDYSFRFISLNDFVCVDRWHAKSIRTQFVHMIAELLKPDIIYMRYPWADASVLRLVQRFKNIVFEHQTKELPELRFIRSPLYADEKKYAKSVMQNVRASVCVTPEIFTYEKRRSGKALHGFVNPNGIDLKGIPVKKRHTSRGLTIICVADFTRWHGYDRLLAGLKRYKGKERVRLYMVGSGPQTEVYKEYVRKHNLEKWVTFFGRCDNEKLDRLFDSADIAVSSLGLFRMGWTDASPLKSREYCARAIPFCYAGNDPDFSSSPDFAYRISSDETPVNINALILFWRRCQRKKDLQRQMRDFALENLSWESKMRNVVSFLRSLQKNKKVHKKVKKITTSSLIARLAFSEKVSIPDSVTRASALFFIGKKKEALHAYAKVLHSVSSLSTLCFRMLPHVEALTKTDLKRRDAFYDAIIALYRKKKKKTLIDHYNTGSLYKKRHMYHEASVCYEEIIFSKHASSELIGGAYFHLGEIALILADRKRARAMFTKCLAHSPTHIKARERRKELCCG
jgi:tetratricopeptide (TPR) repeat protein